MDDIIDGVKTSTLGGKSPLELRRAVRRGRKD